MKASSTCFNQINPLFTRNPETDTFTNSIDPDEMPHNAAFHQVYTVKLKKIFRQKYIVCSMDYPKFIVANKKEQSISIQRVKSMHWVQIIGHISAKYILVRKLSPI